MHEVKNICFVYITPYHPDRGGIGRVTHTLTLEFKRRGYQVFYLILPRAITSRHEYDYPAPLEYLPEDTSETATTIVQAYYDYLRRNKIDVVINQSGNFSDSRLWCLARSKGIPVVSVLHSNPWVAYKHFWSTEIYPLKGPSYKDMLKRFGRIVFYPQLKQQYRKSRIKHFQYLLPNTDRVCLLSKNFCSELSEIVPGYEDRYEVIPNPNPYNVADLTKIKKTKTVLFVGLFSPPKKTDVVIKLWKRVYKDFPEWNLVIVGNGPQSTVDLLKRLSSTVERVSFTGLKPALPYHLKSSILMMTSGYEGWGMVLTEAMQCGTIPIAFNSFASVSDIIEDGKNGILVEPFDMDEYECKLRSLMTDDSRRNEMSMYARESVQRFDVENVVNQWENLFNKLYD